MKTFEVTQQYAGIASARNGSKMSNPRLLGRYEAATITEAVKAAAKEHNLRELLLHAKLVQ